MKNSHEYYQGINYQKLVDSLNAKSNDTISTKIDFNKLTDSEKNNILSMSIQKTDTRIQTLQSQITYFEAMERNSDKYLIEFHRKFALTVAIIILFFVGAPLGAIVRKGGFGAPVVIAALLFMLYFVLITLGENLVESGAVSPFLGMWFASIVLTPIACVLMYAAANDSPLFTKETWGGMWNSIKSLILKPFKK